MKKYLVLLILSFLFILTGCGKHTSDDTLKEFKNKVESTSNYTLTGTMEIISNEKTYMYDLEVAYKQGDYYKVNLINKDNDHEQIILKNEEGVYVITPALNKSFKFQSDWPNNSSQAYILSSLLADTENDSNRGFETVDGKYIFTSKVNYPNNSNLVSQKITLSNKMELEKVEVMNENNINQITVVVTSIDYKTKHDSEYFALSNNVKEVQETETTSSIETVIYPMYLPSGTKFQSEELVGKEEAQRVILTFTGEKPFILVEEAATVSNELEVTSSTGELVLYENLLGALTDTSFNWSDDGMEYYIIGQNLSDQELLQIAASTSPVAITK